MTGKTHVTVGLVTMGCVAYALPDGFTINGAVIAPTIALITTAVGSYLPDIDLPQSHLGQKYHFISKHLRHRGLTHMWFVIPLVLFALLSTFLLIPQDIMRWVNIALLVIFALSCAGIVLPALKKGNIDLYDALHGGLMVSAAAMLLSDLYDAKVICSLVFGLMFGWLMHIFADLFNKPGVPIIPGKNIHFMSVKTKSFQEKGILSRNWQEPVWLACYVAVVLLITFGGQLLW